MTRRDGSGPRGRSLTHAIVAWYLGDDDLCGGGGEERLDERLGHVGADDAEVEDTHRQLEQSGHQRHRHRHSHL